MTCFEGVNGVQGYQRTSCVDCVLLPGIPMSQVVRMTLGNLLAVH